MKQISEHLGRIIAALAAIALLVACVAGFSGDVGNFFGSIFLKVPAIANHVLGALDVIDYEMDLAGPRVVLDQALSKDQDHPTATESSTLVVSGKATDSNDVVSLTVNGKSLAVNADGSWSTSISLSIGALKEIQVVATDGLGQSTTMCYYAVYCKSFTVDVSNRHKVGYTEQENLILEIPEIFYDEDTQKWCKVVQIGYTSDADGSGAFQNCTNLAKVIMPDSVLNIGRYAFTGCTGLETVSFSASLEYIGQSSFSGCANLATLVVPDRVTEIDWSAFEGCSGLTSVKLPSGLMEIEASVFRNCTSLESLVVPDSVKVLGQGAFWGCTSLKRITFGEDSQLNKIGNYVFQNCESLERIVVPQGVTTIGSQAFYGCTSLADVTFSGTSKLTEIGGNAFRNCSLTSFVVPENVTSIGHYAFGGCSYLSKVIIGSKVTSIGHNAFNSCAALDEIIFKGSIDAWNNNVTKDVNWNYNVPATSVFCEEDGQSVALS